MVFGTVDYGKSAHSIVYILAFLVPGRTDVGICCQLCGREPIDCVFGNKGFDRVENILAIIKVAAIQMFLVIAAVLLTGWIGGSKFSPKVPLGFKALFPSGGIGLWSAFIFAFYAYGGIEVLGIMSYRLKKPEEAPKAGKVMLLGLATVYVLSIGLAVIMVPLSAFNPKESPFVLALSSDHLTFIPHLFNGVLIIAGFSTMTASLYAITSMMITLSQEGDAPKVFSKKWKDKYPFLPFV